VAGLLLYAVGEHKAIDEQKYRNEHGYRLYCIQ